MTDVTDLINYYQNLLIIQYHDQPKAQATIDLLVGTALASGILQDIQEGFNIDTAVGAQLDILGKYVDLTRSFQGQNLTGYFTFTNYSDPSTPPGKIGFTDYTQGFTKVGQFLIYSDYLSDTLLLDDTDYRLLIKLRIFQNNLNHSHEAIDSVMWNFFGDTVVPDSVGNMQMYYFVQTPIPAVITVALQKDLLPRPMAVQLALITQTKPFFGFCNYSGYSPAIVGFTSYTTPAIPVGETLTYSDVIFEG